MRSFGERHHGARDAERITDSIPGRNPGEARAMGGYFRRLEERMVAQGFDESYRLRYLVAEARKALDQMGIELSMLARDGLKPPPHGKLKRKRDLR
jgi:hypothetical protein